MCEQDGRVTLFLLSRVDARLPSWRLLRLPPGRWSLLVTSGWGAEVLAVYEVSSDTTPEYSEGWLIPARWGWKPGSPLVST